MAQSSAPTRARSHPGVEPTEQLQVTENRDVFRDLPGLLSTTLREGKRV